jgi:hypothetical protein
MGMGRTCRFPGRSRSGHGIDELQEHRQVEYCTGCQHVRKHVSERDLNPHDCDMRRCSLASYRETNNRRSESFMCVRGPTRTLRT